MRAYRFQAILSLFLAAHFFCIDATAQTTKAQQLVSVAPALRTTPESPQSFDLDAMKGKVVLIFHWRTDCPVCLDKMNELRNNVVGWRSKPFVVVTVNHDKSRQSFQNYLKITTAVDGANAQFIYLYSKDLAVDSLYQSERLPASYILDGQKILKRSYVGRIPAEAWDDIAELLP